MKLVVLLVVLALIEVSWSACPHKLTSAGFRDVEGCFANRMYFPLCGDDGCTYINQGLLDCVNDNNRNEGRPVVNVVSAGMCEDSGSAGANNNGNAAGGAGGDSKQGVTTLASNNNNNMNTGNNTPGDGSINLLGPAKFSTTQSPNNRHLPESTLVQSQDTRSGTRKITGTDAPSSGCSLTSSSILIRTTETMSKMSLNVAREYFRITLDDTTFSAYVTLPEMITPSDKERNIVQTVAAVLLVTALTMFI